MCAVVIVRSTTGMKNVFTSPLITRTVSAIWYVIRRTGWALVVIWLILSATFAFVALTPDPNEALVAWGAAMSGEDAGEAASAYRAAANRDEPLLDRYQRWLIGYATLDWGESRMRRGEPVTDLLAETLPVTLAYVIPGMVVATLAGLAIGLHSALNEQAIGGRVGRAVSYVGICIPNFWLASLMLVYIVGEWQFLAVAYDGAKPPTHPDNATYLILPATVVGLNLLAAQTRFTRSEAMGVVGTEAMKLVRAKGAGPLVVARHVVRNAAIPLVSLFFTELLAALFLTIYVLEVVFGLPGVGKLSYDAIFRRDMALILATAMVPVLVGVFGNLLQDVAYTALDPRVDWTDR